MLLSPALPSIINNDNGTAFGLKLKSSLHWFLTWLRPKNEIGAAVHTKAACLYRKLILPEMLWDTDRPPYTSLIPIP